MSQLEDDERLKAFKSNYDILANTTDRDTISTPDAITRLLKGKTSIKIVKTYMESNKDKHAHSDGRWYDQERKAEIVKTCELIDEFAKGQRQESMRSTERNLSEMNDQILKMRKSLTDKGILDHPEQSGQDESSEQKDEEKDKANSNNSAGKTESKIENRDENSSKVQDASNMSKLLNSQSKLISETEHKNEPDSPVIPQHKAQDGSGSGKQDQAKEVVMISGEDQPQNSRIVDGSQVEEQREQNTLKEQEHKQQSQKDNIEQIDSKQQRRQYTQAQLLKNRTQETSEVEKNRQNIEQQKDLKQSLDHRLQEQRSQKINRMNQLSQPIKHEVSNQSRGKSEHATNKIGSQASSASKNNEEDRQGLLQISRQDIAGEFKTDQDSPSDQITLKDNPQVNPQYQQQGSIQVPEPPHHSNGKATRKKTLSLYPTNLLTNAETEQQKVYIRIKFKLGKLFEHYVKEIKPTALTFDTIPRSLDLTTLLKYCRQFDLIKVVKAGEISKMFKKTAINGLWLEESGFFKMHEVLLELSEEQIKKELEFCRKVQQRLETEKIAKEAAAAELNKQISSNLQEEAQESITMEQKSLITDTKNRRVVEQDQDVVRCNKLLEKLNNIDKQIPDKLIITKLNIRPKQPQAIQYKYDPDKLKRIVQSHVGTSKQLLTVGKSATERRQHIPPQHVAQKQKQPARLKVDNAQERQKHQAVIDRIMQERNHRIDSYAARNKLKREEYPFPSAKSVEMSKKKKGSSQGAKFRNSLATESNANVQIQTQRKSQQSKRQSRPDQSKSRKTEKPLNPIQDRVEIYRELSLPKLPRRQMREQSIYQSLKMINVKPEIQTIKRLVSEQDDREEDQYLKNFAAKERKKAVGEGRKKSPVQQRMKFT